MATKPLGKLDHIGIAVQDFDKARKFFEEVLGARFMFERQRAEDGFQFQEFELCGTYFELIAPMGPDSFVQKFIDKRGEGLHHITFEVPDARERVAELKAKGVRVIEERTWTEESFEAFISPRSAHGVLIQIGSGYPTLTAAAEWFQENKKTQS